MLPALFGGLGSGSHSSFASSTPRSLHELPSTVLAVNADVSNRPEPTQSQTSTSAVDKLVFHYPTVAQPPAARWAHAACSFPANGFHPPCMVVHGGIGSSLLEDICVLDSAMCWRTLTTYTASGPKDKPEKCMGHAACAIGRSMWLFGGEREALAVNLHLV